MTACVMRNLRSYVKDHPALFLYQHAESNAAELIDNFLPDMERQVENLLQEDTPLYIVDEICRDQLSSAFDTSRLDFIGDTFRDNYPKLYERFLRAGILQLELANMLSVCSPLMDKLAFEEKEDADEMQHRIKAALKEYVEQCER